MTNEWFWMILEVDVSRNYHLFGEINSICHTKCQNMENNHHDNNNTKNIKNKEENALMLDNQIHIWLMILIKIREQYCSFASKSYEEECALISEEV